MDTTIVNLSNLETTILLFWEFWLPLWLWIKVWRPSDTFFFAAVLCKKRVKTTG